jgi:hypothetical protein
MLRVHLSRILRNGSSIQIGAKDIADLFRSWAEASDELCIFQIIRKQGDIKGGRKEVHTFVEVGDWGFSLLGIL